MGSLTLPTAGPVYLDANGFIYSVERALHCRVDEFLEDKGG